jgi:hypothetical protein
MMQTNQRKGRLTQNRSNSDEAAVYQICVDGQLEPKWADWFEDFTLSREDGTTLLTGVAIDQAALHGLLARLRDLNLPLVSVQRLKSRDS